MLNTKKHSALRKRYKVYGPALSGMAFLYFLISLYIYQYLNISHAQTITPTFTGTSGNYSTAPFGSISSSVGEPMTTTLFNLPNLILTQGFQQPQAQACSLSVSISSSIANYIWAKKQDAGGTSNDYGSSCSTDPSGNIIVTGNFTSPSITFGTFTLNNAMPGSNDMFIVKYDPNGNVLWAQRAGGTNDDYGYGCSADASGNVFVTGFFRSSSITFGTTTLTNAMSGSYDMFIVKYGSNGNVLWAQSAGGTNDDYGQGCSTDDNGNVIAIGYFNSPFIIFGTTTLNNVGPTNYSDIFIVKYDSNGNVLWAKSGSGTSYDYGSSCSTDANGNIIATGRFQSSSITFGTNILNNAGNSDIFISKLDASGNFLWATQMGAGGADGGESITVDAIGNVYATGYMDAAGKDIFVSKLTAAGIILWTKQMGGTSTDEGLSIALDAAGNVYTTGRFEGTADFDPSGTGIFNLISSGFADIFISSLDNAGNFLWAKQMGGGTGADVGRSIALDAAGNVYTTGSFQGTNSDFDPGPGTFNLSSAGLQDIFVSKLGAVICSGESVTLTATATNGTAPYTYLWSTSETTSSIIVSPPTTITYSVIASDSICMDTGYVTVTVYPSPTIIVSGNTTICSGQNTTLNAAASGGTDFVWSPSTGLSCTTCSNPVASPTITTTYTVTVTSASSCSASDSVTVTVNVPLVVALGPDITQCGGTVTLNAGNTGSTYLWSDSSTNSTLVVTTSGTYSVTVTDGNGCTGSDMINVNIYSPPALSTSASSSACDSATGTASVLVSSGTPPYTYLWSPVGQTTSAATGLAAGNYTVTVTDSAGCVSSASVAVSTALGPTVSISSTSTVCLGDSTLLTATTTGGIPTFTYQWSSGQSVSSIFVTPTGSTSYSVLVTDGNGCTGTDSFTLTVNNTPTITISGNTTICSGDIATLTAGGGNTYSWVPSGQTTPSITAVIPGTYSVIGTDVNSCRDTAAVTVFVFGTPTVAITSAPSQNICIGETVTLTASGGTTYLWQPGGDTDSVINVAPNITTTYTLTASNYTCSATATITITVDSVDAVISGTTSLCIGDATTLMASGGTTYSWWGSGNTDAAITVFATATGTYTYAVTVTGNTGCEDTASITVNVYAPPVASISIASGDPTLCSLDIDTLTAVNTAGPASGYLWAPGGATTSSIPIQPSNPGTTPITLTYTVTVINGSCQDDTTFTITVNPLPTIVAVVDTPDWTNTICKGDVAWISASGGINYYWVNNGSINNPLAVSPTVTTTYTVLGNNSYGCVDTGGVTVVVSEIFADAGNEQTICPGFTAQLDVTVTGDAGGGIDYFWFPADSTLSANDVPNPSATPDSTTAYWVEVFNQYGCWAKDTVKVFVVRSAECVIHVYNGITPNGDGANDVWWIDGIVSFPKNRVWIFNRWGTRVWFGENYDNRNVVWKGTNEKDQYLPDGTYYYIIELYDKDKSVLYSANGWVEVTR